MRLGLASLLSGIAAAPIAAAAAYAQSARVPGSSVVLQWLEQHGFVHPPEPNSPVIYVIEKISGLERVGIPDKPIVAVTGAAQITDPGMLAVNDGNAILLLFALSVLLSVCAIGLSLAAERRGENTLYLSIGFITGTLSLFIISPYWGLIAGAVGVVALLVIRQANVEKHT